MPTTEATTEQPQVWVAMGWEEIDGREPIFLVATSEEAAQMAWDEYVAEACDPNRADREDADPSDPADFSLEYICQQPIFSARR